MHRSFEDSEQTTPEPNVPFGARELQGAAEGGLSELWLAFTHFARSVSLVLTALLLFLNRLCFLTLLA